MFGLIKEGIMELMKDRLRIFIADLTASHSGALTLSFKDFKGCGAPKLFGWRTPIASRHWPADIECAQMMSFCPERSKVRFVAGCMRERAWD